jgi:hypothetical protein
MYHTPETMFMLSLRPEQRDYFTDLIEEAVKMRSEGFNDEEILGRLAHAVLTVESWTSTPRIVRRIVLGGV